MKKEFYISPAFELSSVVTVCLEDDDTTSVQTEGPDTEEEVEGAKKDVVGFEVEPWD